MMQINRNAVLNINKLFKPATQVRGFWEFVNKMFNNPDDERIKLVGPDRACAEWVLRNGGKIVWDGGKKQSDYNALPDDKQAVPKLITIDGTDSSISHYGFLHLKGCTKLSTIILHNGSYIENKAMAGLSHAEPSLTHLQVSSCPDVSDAGIKELKAVKSLKSIVLTDLKSVNNLQECINFLKSQLPNCKIEQKI